jgi:hypothetical protein
MAVPAVLAVGIRLAQQVAALVEETGEAELFQGAGVGLADEHRVEGARGTDGGVTQRGESARGQARRHRITPPRHAARRAQWPVRTCRRRRSGWPAAVWW